MKGLFRAACLAVLIVPALAVAADKEYGCDSVNWGEEVLKAFPNASKGCHSVMMKNNQPYAKYVAEVQGVKADEVTLHMLDTKNKGISKIVIAPKEGATRQDRRKGRRGLEAEEGRQGELLHPARPVGSVCRSGEHTDQHRKPRGPLILGMS